MQQQTGIPTSFIWLLGLSLILVDSLNTPYWQDVATAVRTGGVQASLKTPSAYQGLWRLGGELLLIFLLSLWAQASENGGVFAVVFLVILWVLFLVTHPTGVSTILGRFTRA